VAQSLSRPFFPANPHREISALLFGLSLSDARIIAYYQPYIVCRASFAQLLKAPRHNHRTPPSYRPRHRPDTRGPFSTPRTTIPPRRSRHSRRHSSHLSIAVVGRAGLVTARSSRLSRWWTQKRTYRHGNSPSKLSPLPRRSFSYTHTQSDVCSGRLANHWIPRCFGDKGDVEDITEGTKGHSGRTRLSYHPMSRRSLVDLARYVLTRAY
jgi:hypothetical protein